MRIVCIHQGYELYGSDRSFLMNVLLLREEFAPAELTVVLPRGGELAAAFAAEGVPVEFEDIWVPRRSRGALWLLGRCLVFPAAVLRAGRRIRRSDFVYVNTSVVFDYMVALRALSVPALIHIREIPSGPFARLVRGLAILSGASAVFNSRATRAAFGTAPAGRLWAVLPNAVPDAFAPAPPPAPGGAIFNLLMLGRINAWKGQDFLLEALAAAPGELRRRIRLRVVGAGFEEEARLDALRRFAAEHLEGMVEFAGFQPDPGRSLAWADALVVPSLRPEPFGLVAIEAMSAGRPVIAANHGGLAEIVVDGETGRLFAPGDPEALRAALADVMARAPAMGEAGRRRFLATYSRERYRAGFRDIVAACLAGPRRPAGAPAPTPFGASR
ncbi:glycosyltransferase family 4 protein [Amaricoccus solimangrovi]|uniref:Glycosyltransferase family 4 protein n=1 Tax=Amaricoccus solimangrovi TaxID=2589815 RepID=A0A501WJ69_9RHOB|nr:glycosyltransferase family 4 protein [Amaricoccus solimangrovi]TPE48174.1 glycosyltransferase family 4 protein [Amaricoccus solimangrovi]